MNSRTQCAGSSYFRSFAAATAVLLSTIGGQIFADDVEKPAAKAPPPSTPQSAAAAEAVRGRYGPQLRAARTYKQRAAFAARLLNESAVESDSTTRYAMLRLARQQAVSARDPSLAIDIVNAIDKQFQIAAQDLRVESLQAIVGSASTSEQRRAVMDAAMALVRDAIDAKSPKAVIPLAESLPRLGKRLRDAQRLTAAESLLAKAKITLLAQQQRAAAAEKLAGAPEDPDANYALAMASFESGQWNDGLRQLAKAKQHEKLAQLAQRDIQGAQQAKQFVELAEAWTKAAADRPEWGVLRGRALYWIHRAIPRLEGGERKKWEQQATTLTAELKSWKAQRAEELEQQAISSQQTSTKSAKTAANGKLSTGDAPSTSTETPPQPAKGVLEHRFEAHRGAANGVCFHPKEPWMASCGDDGVVHVWNLTTRRKLWTLEGHTGAVYAVAFAADGKRLASAGADKTLRIWTLPNPKRGSQEVADPVVLQGHATRLRDAAVAYNGAYAATCADDNRVGFWDLKTGRYVAREEHKGIVYAVAQSPTDHVAASVGEDGRVQIWNRLAPGLSWIGHAGKATAVAFAPTGKLLASGGEDRAIHLWDLKKSAKKSLPLDKAAINDLAFSHHLKLLASASRDRTVKVWRYETRTLVGLFEGHKNEVLALAFAKDDKWIAAADRSGQVLLWRAP